MDYLDIRIRLPANKLGQFIIDLPPWAQMLGVDRLQAVVPTVSKTHKQVSKADGYVPRKGTVIEAVLRYMHGKDPMRTVHVINAFSNKYPKKSINTAFYTLRHHGLIQQLKDKTYVVTDQK